MYFFFAVTSHHIVETPVLSVSDFGWFCQVWFQSQGGLIIACALLSFVCNDPHSQLWIPRPRPDPNFTPWYGEGTAGVTAQCHFWDGWHKQDSNIPVCILQTLVYIFMCIVGGIQYGLHVTLGHFSGRSPDHYLLLLTIIKWHTCCVTFVNWFTFVTVNNTIENVWDAL